MRRLTTALRAVGEAARTVEDRRSGWSKAPALDAVIAKQLAALSRPYEMTMFESAARDAIRSECEHWMALRRTPEAAEKSRCLESARTIADRCRALLINLEQRK